MKEQRPEFARTHVNWRVEDWKDVRFSDESNLELGFRFQEKCCRTPGGSPLCPAVHKEDCPTLTQGHGVGLLQLKMDKGSSS
jgi:hypothetical protein